MTNPLLQDNHLPVDYPAITLADLQAAFSQVLSAHEQGILTIIQNQQAMPTWDDMVLAVDDLDARLLVVLYAASPLIGKGQAWAEAIIGFFAKATARFEQKFSNAALQDLYQRLANSDIGRQLDAHKRTMLRWQLRQFAAGGSLLNAADKMRLLELNEQIGQGRDAFRRNLGRPGITLAECELAGITPRVREELAARAQQEGQAGWLVACESAVTDTVLQQAETRSVRERVYRAFHRRGVSDVAEQDNGVHLQRLAQRLNEKARLLGYCGHLEQSLQGKSAGSVQDVTSFLRDLAKQVRPAMLNWRMDVEQRASARGLPDVRPWDIAYLQTVPGVTGTSERMREYYPLNAVVTALQQLARRLFAVELQASLLPVWDASVQGFEVWQDHAFIGHLYLDAVQHPGKQAEAVYTTYLRNRRVTAEGIFQPAAVVVFSDVPQAIQGSQPLLDHLSLRKLYHEFGHALHHLLVRTTTHVMSNVTELGTDGVELFGKLFERWVWDAGYLASISSHQADGSQLTRPQVETWLTGLKQQTVEETARNLSLALFDIDLHGKPDDGRSLAQRLDEARALCGYWPLADFERPAHAFEHLVDGYDAGYYAYLWSDVHALDLFTRFEAQGLLDRATGRALQDALIAPGATRPLGEGIEAFLGRAASQAAYLSWHGLK